MPWFLILVLVFVSGSFSRLWFQSTKQAELDQAQVKILEEKLVEEEDNLASLSLEYEEFKNTDQVKRNDELEKEIEELQAGFSLAAEQYDNLLALDEEIKQDKELGIELVKAITYLSERNYASASGLLATIEKTVNEERAKNVAQTPVVAANIETSNIPPENGLKRQAVDTDVGKFQVDILSADLGSTRVVVETASSGDCGNECPVASLADYVSRAGGFAGINGPYFCPAEYAGCAGKTNSFDTLLMNRQKVYFNSDNNVYSNVPAVIFSGSGARFVGRSLEWGRDTSPDSVIASQPLLLMGSEIKFGGDGDPKKGSRGNRSFIGTRGSKVYIGVVRSATVAEVAYVLKALGLENALNLDSGGSTAFMHSGRYVAGPGRNTPFGIVLVAK